MIGPNAGRTTIETHRYTESNGAALEGGLRDGQQHDDDARAGESGHGPEGIEARAERTASRHVVRVPGRWAGFFGPARASVDDPSEGAEKGSAGGGCDHHVTSVDHISIVLPTLPWVPLSERSRLTVYITDDLLADEQAVSSDDLGRLLLPKIQEGVALLRNRKRPADALRRLAG